jgi:hypothetical protein
VVEVVQSPLAGPADEVSGSLALDSDGDAHIAYNDTTGKGVLKYLKVVLHGDRVIDQITEIVDSVRTRDGVGRSVEISLDASNRAHVGYLDDGATPGPAVRYAHQIECPGPVPSLSPSRAVFYELPQRETFYITNVGVGDLEIDSIRFGGRFNTNEGDWYFVDCTEDQPLDFFEGDVSEPTSADFDPPVVLAEGEFGAVCVGFEPARIEDGMLIELLAYSSAGTQLASLSAGGTAEQQGDGCDSCGGCAMSSPNGGLDVPTLVAVSMFAGAVLLWRTVRLRG